MTRCERAIRCLAGAVRPEQRATLVANLLAVAGKGDQALADLAWRLIVRLEDQQIAAEGGPSVQQVEREAAAIRSRWSAEEKIIRGSGFQRTAADLRRWGDE